MCLREQTRLISRISPRLRVLKTKNRKPVRAGILFYVAHLLFSFNTTKVNTFLVTPKQISSALPVISDLLSRHGRPSPLSYPAFSLVMADLIGHLVRSVQMPSLAMLFGQKSARESIQATVNICTALFRHRSRQSAFSVYYEGIPF